MDGGLRGRGPMKRKKALITVFLLCTLGLIALVTGPDQKEFSGDRAAAPDTYRLDAARMSGTDTHTLELRTGDMLQIQFETTEGSLHLKIEAPDGTALYEGDGRTATDFTVNIPQSGAYSVTVEARRAKGNIHIQMKAREQ